MSDMPCAKCPWTSKDPEVKALMEKHKVHEAAAKGAWFCCHVNMGTCHGAARYAEAVGKRAA